MHKIIKKALCCFVIVGTLFLISAWTVKAQESGEGTELYIVYDNSNSMCADDSNAAWCKAAYAVEILTAMMDEKDSITIYFMSETPPYYVKKEFRPEGNTREALQKSMHDALDELSYTRNTFINGLHQAIADIKKSSGENKQLLILSDGVFNRDKESGEVEEIDLDAELPGITKSYFKMNHGEKTQKGNTIDYVTGSIAFFQGDENNMLQKFIEVGNYIYNRQLADTMQSGGRVSVTLVLPAKRLIVLAQSQDTGILAGQIAEKSDGLETASGVSCQSLKGDEEKKTDFSCYAGIKTYTAEPLIPAGTYDITVPEGAEVTVYAEYEMQYTVCLENENGEEWDIRDEQGGEEFREGTYKLKVKLVDSLNNELVEGTGLDDKLQAYLSLDGENIKMDSGSSKFIPEGPHTIKGSIELEGNAPTEMEYSFAVRHRLGNVEMEIVSPDEGFDIDNIGEKKEGLFVTLLEDGENISDTDGIELREPENDGKNKCTIEKTPEGWYVYPELPEGGIGKEEFYDGTKLVLEITGEIEGEPVKVREEYLISYYALPQQITFEETYREMRDALAFFVHNKVQFTPLLGDEPVKEGGIIENIETAVLPESLPEGIEIKEISAVRDSGIWKIEMTFKRDRKLWFLKDGVTLSGNAKVTLDRYGVECSGDLPFTVVIGKFRIISWMFLILCVLILLCFVWNVIRRFILKSSFWLMPVSVELKTYYGNKDKTIRMPVKRKRLSNFIHQIHPGIAIPLEKVRYLGFSDYIPNELVLKRKLWSGRCVVANIEEFAGSGCVIAKNNRKITTMSGEFGLEEGLEWTLLGKRNTVIRISLKGNEEE